MPIEGDRMKVQYQYQTDLGMLYIVQEDDAIAEVGILQPNQIIPYEKNLELQQLVSAVIEQTNAEIQNLTQSMGFAVKMGGKTVFTPLSEYMQRTLDKAMMDISTGTFGYNTVIKRTVKEMTDSGLRTVEYASGRRASHRASR